MYKGILSGPDSTNVAVKRLLKVESAEGEMAFLREVELISIAVHKNILRLIGFCTTSTERLLVYPFMENLSVASRLRGRAELSSYLYTSLCVPDYNLSIGIWLIFIQKCLSN